MFQPLKDLSTNIVTLSFSIYNFEQLDGSYTSDMKEQHGVFWWDLSLSLKRPIRFFRCVRVQSNKTAKSQKRRVSIFLQCNPKNPASNWSVVTSFGFRIINTWSAKNKISSLFYHNFTAKDSSKGAQSFMPWEELTATNSGFLVDGTFQIEFDLNVTACTGIKKEKLSKELFDKFIADGKLIVDEKEINVCLPVRSFPSTRQLTCFQLLAEHSPFLYKMFYLDNPEQKKTFEIFDFTHEAVQGMVSILQQDSFDVTCESCLNVFHSVLHFFSAQLSRTAGTCRGLRDLSSDG